MEMLRIYVTPQKWKKMSHIPDVCWHGCGEKGSFIHLLWYCQEVYRFWICVKDMVCSVFRVKFPLWLAVNL